MRSYKKKLKQLEGQYRLRSLNKPSGIDFTSNDYLGFRNHPLMREAAAKAIEAGVDLGSGGSRLLRGHTQYHEDLESYAAEFFGHKKALYFPTGFQANYALFSTLPTRHDTIIFDEFIHASARDGIAASHAKTVKAAHNDLQSYEDALKRAQENRRADGQIWIAVDSLYSMDGDLAPLKALYGLAQKYESMLFVDEAHATGVLGTQGRGLMYDIGTDNVIVQHACGKALGVAGGLICASSEIVDMLINTARPFIFSTAPPPLQAHLAQKALELCASDVGGQARAKLHAHVSAAGQALGREGSTHIVPIILGADEAAVEAAGILQAAGYDIRAIRPPTVPEGTARLRLTLSANLNPKDLNDVFQILTENIFRSAA